ncbi:hypothetical protein [Streptomyces sp. NBC_01497]|uniref:hypothetical protein n=1 Tax=Streptomyces sp. NBC_01497 TaxID=2903885 RepID=UPI002E305AD4|nr:hypothetical protein [Streptomyces sp. NBC_01497]
MNIALNDSASALSAGLPIALGEIGSHVIRDRPADEAARGEVDDVLRVRFTCGDVAADQGRGLRRGPVRVRHRGALPAPLAQTRQAGLVHHTGDPFMVCRSPSSRSSAVMWCVRFSGRGRKNHSRLSAFGSFGH